MEDANFETMKIVSISAVASGNALIYWQVPLVYGSG